MSNFNQLTITDLNETNLCDSGFINYPIVANIDELTADELLDVNNRHETDLECIEMWAEENGLIYSESSCQDRYEDMLLDYPLELLVQYANDTIMASEDESNTLDAWVTDGQLHPEQYSSYEMSIDYSDLVRRKAYA